MAEGSYPMDPHGVLSTTFKQAGFQPDFVRHFPAMSIDSSGTRVHLHFRRI